VDVAMLDSMISAMSSNYMTFLGSGKVPRPMGNAFLTVVPYAVFEGSDGRFSIAVGSEKLWAAFCRTIERVDLETHPDFATNPKRVENRQALHRILNEVFRVHSVAAWIQRLSAAGIPCSPVLNFAEVAAHPQTVVREMFPKIGAHRVTGAPVKLSDTPARVREGAPKLGEHTDMVLADLLELDARIIEDLRRAGIIGTGSG
jgi:crotonobetainyl-CoA:carnitine CoA-transferase CaiB-like acyl-CoA transferase